MKKVVILCLAIAAIAVILFTANLAAGNKAVEATAPILTSGQRELFRTVQNAIFVVHPLDPRYRRGGGTGFLVRLKNGKKVIITNRHVCEMHGTEKNAVVLERDEHFNIGLIVAKSDLEDLCMILPSKAISETTEPLKLSRRLPAAGDQASIIGHPNLEKLTQRWGHISHIGVETMNLEDDHNMVNLRTAFIGTTNIEAYPGSSGSPLLNAAGQVIGVVFAQNISDKTGDFIPEESLIHFLETFE